MCARARFLLKNNLEQKYHVIYQTTDKLGH